MKATIMMMTMRPDPRSRLCLTACLVMECSSSLAEVVEIKAHVPDIGRGFEKVPLVLVVGGGPRAVGKGRPAVGLNGAGDRASDRCEGLVRPAEDPHADLLDPGDLGQSPSGVPGRPAVENEVVVHVAVILELEVLDVPGHREVDAVVGAVEHTALPAADVAVDARGQPRVVAGDVEPISLDVDKADRAPVVIVGAAARPG